VKEADKGPGTVPLYLEKILAAFAIAIVVVLVPFTLFAAVALFPLYTCNGAGAGGNCGEGLLASLPLALLLIPADIFAAIVAARRLIRLVWPGGNIQASPRTKVSRASRLGVILSLELAFAIGLPWWIVNGSGTRPRTYHYRLTFYVDTPEGPRQGSNVIEVDTRFYDGVFGAELKSMEGVESRNPKYFTTLKGEATSIDLGSRGVLFSLLVGDQRRIGQDYPDKPYIVADWAFPLWYHAGTIGLDGKYRDYLDELIRRKPKVGVDLTYVPMLVRFDDMNAPTSVKIVDPFNLAESFGPGVALRRVTFEITDETATSGISAQLPWLENSSSNSLLFALAPRERQRSETAQIDALMYDDFRSVSP
jgi:hypothetical protein